MATAATDRPFSGEALVGRVFEQTIGAFEALNVYIGERLGLYRALADGGPATATDLAARAGVAPRYAREWLEQQTVAGVLEVDDPLAGEDARRYVLPPEHRAPLLDEDSLAYIAFMPRFIASVALAMPALLDAFRTGLGVPWEAYGVDMREAQASANRVLTLTVVGQDWLPTIPDIHDRLTAQPPARVADLCCGEGWLSIGLAQAYPDIDVVGFDLDPASIDAARRHVAAAGVADRVSFELGDVARAGSGEPFDLVTIFEALHDLSRPVDTLRGARSRLAPGGSVLVFDERTADAFTGMALDNPMERFFYAVSTTVCLPGGLVEQPSAATGTVIRASTVARYAHEAGFDRTEVLPIEHDSFRVYRLRH
jgi:2-polyprenyl-3-methyl-5-hydroxy-6-metoxy-1,4-benzoquinol methylase